ncbi:MAG: carbohydrate ABC transporter permease [Lachnospiraceae bacterium]|nr:carbohydrate ABC transporter permease [Lachnospiraceae bacterium]
MKKNRRPIRPGEVVKYILFTLLALIYILPLVWVLNVSVKTNAQLFSDPFGLSAAPQWVNYYVAFFTAGLGVALKNSFIVCTVTLVVSMIVGAMAAFGIARLHWKASGPCLLYYMTGMMVPVHCVLIPLFVTFSKIGLVNNLFGLTLPYITFSLPITIFILNGFFQSMPHELLEAACIDGANIYDCFFRIALPLAKSGLFVTGLMTFIGNWNELLVAMVFISDPIKKTLPVSLTSFASPYATNYTQMFAAIVISVLPTIIVYCIFSDKIVSGLTAGAVKG